MQCVHVTLCAHMCESLRVLTVWCDCLNRLALASHVPYGQSSIRVTANELLAFVVPGDRVDGLVDDSTTGSERSLSRRGAK